MITVRGREPDTLEPAQTAFAHLAVCAFDKMMVIAEALREFNLRRGRQIVPLDHRQGHRTLDQSDAVALHVRFRCSIEQDGDVLPAQRRHEPGSG